MMKWILTALCGFLLAAVAITAFDPGAGENARIRLISLESLLNAKEVSIKASWRQLEDIEARIGDMERREREANAGKPSANRAADLLKLAQERTVLDGRRLEILRSLDRDYREASSLKSEIAQSRKDLAANAGFVEGKWRATLMPAGTSGTVTLVQNGALVNGSYMLENGRHGNLQGTLVNGQLVLERIDSRYGRAGRFVLKTGKNENELNGTWFSYDVTSGQPLSGAMKLERIASGSPGD